LAKTKSYLQFKIPPTYKFRQKANKKLDKYFVDLCIISKWQFSKQVYTSFWMRHFLLMFLALNPINDFELQTYFLTLKFAALKVVLKKKSFIFSFFFVRNCVSTKSHQNKIIRFIIIITTNLFSDIHLPINCNVLLRVFKLFCQISFHQIVRDIANYNQRIVFSTERNYLYNLKAL